MISSKTNIPFMGFGPYGEGNHGPNEWVSLQSIKDTKEVFKKFIEKI
jgi:acetylornithine deacetylase/succinyl-diaminopimelate desuccinylase-like protein